MNCYECAKDGGETVAVALCQKCNAGLCLQHLRETASRIGPGGTFSITCHHDTWERSAAAAPTRARA